MPVTRDLSDAKRALLLKWLREVGDDGRSRRSATLAAAGPETIESVAPAPRYAATAFPVKMDLIRHKPLNKA
jgi:hypothetical protein